MRFVHPLSTALRTGSMLALLAASLLAQEPAAPSSTMQQTAVQPPRPPRIVRPGVATPGVSRKLEDLHKEAVFPVEGSPDWSVVTKDAVWITSSRANHVVQLDATTNQPGLIADIKRPCSGLAEGFGSIWVPSCGDKTLVRLDPATAKPIATIPAEPENSEGGITTGAGSVWLIVKPSKLLRIDPAANAISGSVDLPSGSANPFFGGGFVWVTAFDHDALLKVDPKTLTILATIPTGPKPRFLTVGAGSVWTLNQGDGTISRIAMDTGKLVATVTCGIPGSGGDITFGSGYVWATIFDFPLTQVDPASNKVVKQWAGQGGDGMRAGLGSVWLSNLRQQTVWRISPKQD
jgi:virginiamycin B lyase